MLPLSTFSFIHFFLSFIHFFLLSLFICCCTSFLFYLFLSFPQTISVSAFKSISSYLSLVYLVRFFVWVYDVSPIAQVPDNLFPDKNSPIAKSPIDPTARQAQVPDCKPNPNSPIAQVPDCLSPRLPKSPITKLPDNQIPDRPNSPTGPSPRLQTRSQLSDRPKSPIAQVPGYLFPDKNS